MTPILVAAVVGLSLVGLSLWILRRAKKLNADSLAQLHRSEELETAALLYAKLGAELHEPKAKKSRKKGQR